MSRIDKHTLGDEVIIMAAPNGARRTHVDHPMLPMTAAESAAEARELVDAGVSILHLHVRDENGEHSIDPALYREAIRAVREAVGDELVIQITTEAVGRYQPEEQMACVRELSPEAVSIALRELCPDDAARDTFAGFCRDMRAAGTWPQYILYTIEDVQRFERYRAEGVFDDRSPFVMLVVGAYAPARDGSVADLDALLAALSGECPWAVCCFGGQEQAVALAALERGGHVRLGFENNLLLPDGSTAPDNAALVRAFRAAAPAGSRPPASAETIRSALLDPL